MSNNAPQQLRIDSVCGICADTVTGSRFDLEEQADVASRVDAGKGVATIKVSATVNHIYQGNGELGCIQMAFYPTGANWVWDFQPDSGIAKHDRTFPPKILANRGLDPQTWKSWMHKLAEARKELPNGVIVAPPYYKASDTLSEISNFIGVLVVCSCSVLIMFGLLVFCCYLMWTEEDRSQHALQARRERCNSRLLKWQNEVNEELANRGAFVKTQSFSNYVTKHNEEGESYEDIEVTAHWLVFAVTRESIVSLKNEPHLHGPTSGLPEDCLNLSHIF